MNLLTKRKHDVRSFQLLFVFAIIERQYGFATEIANRGIEQTGDKFFEEMREYAQNQVSTISFQWPFFAVRNRMGRAFDAIFK